MVKRTVREFLDALADQDVLAELSGSGTDTKTSDWVLKKVAEITLTDLEIQRKREVIMQLEMERDRLLLDNTELRELIRNISDVNLERKSLQVRMECDFAQLLTVIAAKLEDVMGRLGFLTEEEEMDER